MSCYDTVNFHCPKCKSELKTHSKVGRCNLADFYAIAVPPAIAADLEGEKLFCQCGAEYVIRSRVPRRVELYLDENLECDDDFY
jgi:uncharacterized protein YbaR (Trm112 family)